jgi:hypothetical protein
MDQATIARYQPGGDIYANFLGQYGQAGANAIAAAAQSGDETQINAALVQVKFGNPLPTSTAAILGNQLATDPLGAPLGAANKVLGNTLLSFLKSPFVLLTVGVVLFFSFGGADLIRRKMAAVK